MGRRSVTLEAPTRRIRSKSAPRGRSPNPKMLKQAAKASASGGAYVTPPPKQAAVVSPTSGGEKVRRSITFGANSVHPIKAENQRPMNLAEADKILGAMKSSSEKQQDPKFKRF